MVQDQEFERVSRAEDRLLGGQLFSPPPLHLGARLGLFGLGRHVVLDADLGLGQLFAGELHGLV